MKFLSTNTACAKRTAVALCTVLATMTAAVETNAQTWTGATPSNANGKTVYLYNVGAKKFLGKGGRWGTEANLNYEGVPFTLTYSSYAQTFTLRSEVKGQGSSSKGYLQIMDGTSSTSTHDAGNYFVDRADASAITPTSATTADGKTAYTLNVTTAGTSTNYYIVGNSDNAVASEERISDASYGQWMIVTEEERREAFQAAEAANAKPVNATFLMYDFDFARNDNSISFWKTGTDASSSLSYYTSALRLPSYAQGGTVKTYTHTYTSKHDAAYTSTSGSTSSSYTEHTATFTITTCVPADQMPHTITAECGGETKTSRGTNYTHSSEEVEYTLSSTTESTSSVDAYTYYVGNGYYDGDKADATNTSEFTKNNTTYLFDAITGAQHYAEKNRQSTFGGNWTANIHGASGAVSQTLSTDNMVRKGYYRISCKAFTTATTGNVRLWAASGDNGNGSSDDQNNNDKYAYRPITAITDAPATYVAASELLQSNVTTYDASVRVYVENISDLLKFGIYVADADADAWTCFDDFAIEYLGDPQSTLVLDEDQADGAYIKAQATSDDELKTVKLYLHRSLNVGKWNSLVLPVDLTVGQVKSAFGDQVRISEFQGANDPSRPETIIFTAINANRDNNDETAIKAGNLYLVKPTEAMPTDLEEVEVPTTSDEITSYYSIVGVTYAKASDVASKNYNDKVEGKEGAETFGSDTKVKFVGTYIKLSNDGDKIPENSYVLNGNNVGGTAGVWYYRTVKTASKGFRGWLQTVDGNASNGIKYSIDGVEETANGATTSIDNVLDENNTTISGNVYTLGGQLVKANATSLDGLAAGIYIVGGKKVVK